MTANQYRAALARLDLTQTGAAQLVGADPRTSRRWIAGETSIPESVAIILRLMLRGKISADDVEQAKR